MMKSWLGLLQLIAVLPFLLAATSDANFLHIALESGIASTFELNLLETLGAYKESWFEEVALKLFGLDDEFEIEELELEQEIYDTILESLELSEYERANIDFDFKYKVHTPRIQSHYNYYNSIKNNYNLEGLKDSFGNDVSVDGKVENWILFNDVIYASIDDLYALKTDSRSNALLTEFDRVFGTKGPLIIFYGNHKSEDFKLFFLNLYESARIGKLRFVWRYIPDSDKSERILGFGVDLTIKNPGHLVVDDAKSVNKQRLDMLKDQVKIEEGRIHPLKKGSLKSLGLKLSTMVLSEKIADVDDKLKFLTRVLNNFLKYGSYIQNSNVDIDEVVSAVKKNENIGLSKDSYGLYVNGSPIHKLQLNFLSLINKIKEESQIILSLAKFGLNPKQSKFLLQKFAMITAYKESQFRSGNTIMGKNENRFKIYDFKFSKDHKHGVVFLNDIGKDETYSQYTSDQDEAYLGLNLQANQIPALRENVHDAVFAINMTDKSQLRVFFALSKIILDNGIPQQVGVLPIAETAQDKLIAKKFYHIVESSSLQEALAFLYKYLESDDDEEFEELFDKIDISQYDFDESVYESTLKRFEINEPSLLVNGVILDLLSPDWQISMSKQISQDISLLKKHLKSDNKSELPLKDVLYTHARDFRDTRIIPSEPQNALYKAIDQDLVDASIVFRKSSETKGTFWAVGNLNNAGFKKQLENLMIAIKSEDYQIRLLNTGNSPELIEQMSAFALKKLSNSKIDMLITILQASSQKIDGVNKENIKLLEEKNLPVLHDFILFNSRYLRVDIPLNEQELVQLAEFETSQRLSIISDIINAYPGVFDHKSIDIFTKDDATRFDILSSILTKSFHSDDKLFITDVARFDFSKIDYTNSFDVGSGNLAEVLIILDPVSENAQHLISMANIIKDIPYVSIRLLLHPSLHSEELGIQRFYRGGNVEETFDNNGQWIFDSQVVIANIPTEFEYTVEIDTPTKWLTVSKYSTGVDLENFKISEGESAFGVFELKSLLIEGSIKDVGTGSTPLGASIRLDNSELHTESSAMAAMGYIQLQGKPGTNQLSLEDTTSKYYNLLSASEIRFSSNQIPIEFANVNIFDLHGKRIHYRVNKKDSNTSLTLVVDDYSNEDEELNIFSIASGHQYERLLSIMVSSVVKNTKSPVKFWLIENYLSGEFKRFLPELAKAKNFKYELISYKWPNFLRKQREKHRSIWAYKILFLDLIFPKNLSRVIFIDADQVVQGDLKELNEIDLNGAPYGFVPMCEDREDMEGYRFWKTGYWEKVLGDDLKYHISALFVVDLNRFRQLKVGEKLRGHYQKLSLDEQSLANLDQDLPNNLQRVVPIFSLPQEWLWCDTWCHERGKSKAKAIDLCDNPLVKGDKLKRAAEIVPNWGKFDRDIQLVKSKVKEAEKILAKKEEEGSDESSDDELEHDEL